MTFLCNRIGEKLARLNCLGCIGEALSSEDCWRRGTRHIQVDLRWSRREADAIWVLMADRALSSHGGLSEVSEFLTVDDLETMVNVFSGRRASCSAIQEKSRNRLQVDF